MITMISCACGHVGLADASTLPRLPADFRTIDKLRDWLPIRREQCGQDDFRIRRRGAGRRNGLHCSYGPYRA
jgi:hypothetical protein